jgi:hypothetical protein
MPVGAALVLKVTALVMPVPFPANPLAVTVPDKYVAVCVPGVPMRMMPVVSAALPTLPMSML